MPPRCTGFNEYMPQGQRTLTEVDGVVEIGPVGPATQKEVAPAQANTSRKRDAAEAAAQPAAARRAARDHATAAQGRSGRGPAASCDSRTTGRQQREARAGCQHQYDDTHRGHRVATRQGGGAARRGGE